MLESIFPAFTDRRTRERQRAQTAYRAMMVRLSQNEHIPPGTIDATVKAAEITPTAFRADTAALVRRAELLKIVADGPARSARYTAAQESLVAYFAEHHRYLERFRAEASRLHGAADEAMAAVQTAYQASVELRAVEQFLALRAEGVEPVEADGGFSISPLQPITAASNV